MSHAPSSTPLIVELRTLLLELSEQLTVFERTLAKAESPTRRTRCLIGSPALPEEREQRLGALRTRLVLISELVSAMDRGQALVSAETQLMELMLTNSIERLQALQADVPSPGEPEPPTLPLAPGPG